MLNLIPQRQTFHLTIYTYITIYIYNCLVETQNMLNQPSSTVDGRQREFMVPTCVSVLFILLLNHSNHWTCSTYSCSGSMKDSYVFYITSDLMNSSNGWTFWTIDRKGWVIFLNHSNSWTCIFYDILVLTEPFEPLNVLNQRVLCIEKVEWYIYHNL